MHKDPITPVPSPERLALIERYYNDQMDNMDFVNSEFFIKKGVRAEAEGMTDAELREQLGEI